MTYWAKVTTRFEGFHKYPDAPEEVWFLKHMHRHMFHVTVWLQQFHTERDIEYIMFLHKLETMVQSLRNGQAKSCETMAEQIVRWVMGEYPGRTVKVEVTEDGESGALVELEWKR